jgi:OOP family OmpA-OmpF porin
MNKNLLCCALLGALGFAQAATAQEYDDRWYVSGDFGHAVFDDSREIRDNWIYKIGVGRFFAPRWSWELGLNSTNPSREEFNQLNWSMYGIDLTGRYHWIEEGRDWAPYILFGVGALRHAQEAPNPLGGSPLERKGTELSAHGGIGLMFNVSSRTSIRTEFSGRFDFDDTSGFGEDQFVDYIATLGVMFKFGPEPSAPIVEPEPMPEPMQPDCSTMDDDGDGVNNCVDKCPNSTAGQTIGPDGCPVPVTIDLRGVNFDFDKDTLRPDSIATLNEAVTVLRQYPDLRVEVAGHTDECGSDNYNADLSNRRARVVYDYLTSNGVDGGRLAGPNGYGEDRPLELLGDAFPACKSETNRRTELNVQN